MSSNQPSPSSKINSYVCVKSKNESMNETSSSDEDFMSLLPKKGEIRTTINSLISTEKNNNSPSKITPSASSDIFDKDDNDDDDKSDSDFENLLKIASTFFQNKTDANNTSSAIVSKLRTIVDNSKDISNPAKESLKVPLIRKSKRTKRTNSSTIDYINSTNSMKEDSENIPNLNLAKETSKAPVNSRRRIAKRSAIDSASSSNAVTKEDSKNISNSKQTKESIKVPVNPRKGRAKKTKNEEEKTILSASSSSSFIEKNLNETSSSTLEKTLITEPKKTRGKKPKAAKQAESSNDDNVNFSKRITRSSTTAKKSL